MKHRISAGVLVQDEGRVLLVRHVKRGAYDFWVAPGGGVIGDESLEDAARREAREETGIEVEPLRLACIEELMQPGQRHCKFWFHARAVGGRLSCDTPEARAEHIAETAWLAPSELAGKTVFPSVLAERYWQDPERDSETVVRLPLRHMAFW
jgi:8-oxo-dGTP diphosphatase